VSSLPVVPIRPGEDGAESTSGSATAIKGCLLDNWTKGSNRIDVVWAGITGSDNGSLDYSRHRAVKARVHYS
jgi:hypothetical protein